ncbi:MAG TPA: glycosyltransferase family 4 protein [Oculatellaceae cyanobacterium]|jgi:glycosyltransferase involved in cell wall biosynthesis
MKILLVNNLFSRTNGADVMTYHLYRMLNEHGHTAFVFAGDRKPYFEPDYPYQHFFPEAKELSELSGLDYLRHFFKPLYNHEAYRKLKAYLQDIRPDLVHLQGIQRYLSPSVIQACKEASLPVVMTVHDPFYVCPASTLMRAETTYCDELLCITQDPSQCIQHRCMRGSLTKSIYNALEFKLRQWHKLYDQVDHFLTPSRAFRDLLIRAGMPSGKVTAIYNCIEDRYFEQPLPDKPGQYILYVGRLVREKGLDYLLKAMALCPDVSLRIVGEGPFRSELEALKQALNLHNVEFVGFRSGDALMAEYANCLATVLPCNWFETFGLTIAESFALGKPVIASALGAIPELIKDGVDGWLVPPTDVPALAEAIQKAAAEPARTQAMGLTGRRKTEAMFTSRHYYENTVNFYQWVLGDKKSGTAYTEQPASLAARL